MPNAEPTSLHDAGWRWPAEWAPQQSVWLAWPHDASLWPLNLEPIWETIADLIAELSAVQRVDLLVQNEDVKAHAETAIGKGRCRRKSPEGHVVFHEIPTDDSWLRDTGPIFVNRVQSGVREQAAVGFRFNGWGKFAPFDTDAKVAERIAAEIEMPFFHSGVVLEGGAIDGNGCGVVLSTEQCVLNDNRNPGLLKSDYERLLKDRLGAEAVVWLAGGLLNDHTDGHVDVVARFVDEDAIAVATTNDRNNPSFAMLDENRRRLIAWDGHGSPFRLIELPIPEPIEFEGQMLPAGYANFVIANRLIVVPMYDSKTDADALQLLSDAFPDRRIVGLSAVELLKGGGAFHCLTQQQPAVA